MVDHEIATSGAVAARTRQIAHPDARDRGINHLAHAQRLDAELTTTS
jgi:hypothetical protein